MSIVPQSVSPMSFLGRNPDMPNWTDDEGTSWFSLLECKRCLKNFTAVDGEVPVHLCIGGYYRSISGRGVWHQPIRCKGAEDE